jgi:hypothetical protein
MKAAARRLVCAQRRDLYHAAHAGAQAGVEQRARRGVVQRVEAASAALAQDADGVHHGVDALQRRQPVRGPERAREIDLPREHLVPRGAQRRGGVPADEAARAEDEDPQAASAETSSESGR